MRRPVICFVLIAAAATACSRVPEPHGPAQPMTVQVIGLDDLRLAGQARSAALTFLRAYARSPSDGGRALEPLMEGLRAREWAHWLGVQYDAFPGRLDGSLQLGHLGGALPVRSEDGSLDELVAYGVQVRATVVFDVKDEDGQQRPPLRRVIDGLIVLVLGPDGTFRVLSFDRDGLRLDQFFQVFEDTRDRQGGVTVELRSLLHVDQWQFGVEITNRTGRPLRVIPGLTSLLTEVGEPETGRLAIVTFEGPIPPGESAEGLLTFSAPTDTNGLDLQIAVAGPDDQPTGFVFGVPPPPGTGTGTSAGSESP
jgi:hypothetical protein